MSEPTGFAVVPASSAEEKLQPFLAKLEPALAKVLPKHFTVERIVTAALMAATKTPEIANCSKESIALAIMKCARLGLDIGEDIHLVPVKKSLEAWPDYKGLMRLAMQGGLVRDMVPYVVYEGDRLEMEQGLHEYLRHYPAPVSKRGALIGAFVIITKRYGVRTFHYMQIEEIEERRKNSRSWSDKALAEVAQRSQKQPERGPFEWYCKKTVIRDWLNRQPKSAKLTEALAMDDTESPQEPPPDVDLATGEVLDDPPVA